MPGTIIFEGTINPNAAQAPGVYIQNLIDGLALIQGAPSDIVGLVGIASWGPVGSPVTISSPDDYQYHYGPVLAQKYDMGTHVNIISSNGGTNMRCVRVTDGTDTAATTNVMDTAGTPAIGMALSAYYTGVFGNSIKAFISAGSNSTVANPTYKITVALPNLIPEVFDNIGGTGAALWQNMVNAINMGQGPQRSPSLFVTATLGAGTAAPNLTSYTLSGGTNGNTTITGTVLQGVDTAPRKGMYALRNTGCSMAILCDCDDANSYSAQLAYGASEGCFMLLTGPAGQSIDAAINAKTTAGIDSRMGKFLVGDWALYRDSYNKVDRYVSPQSYAAGVYASRSPEESGLNKIVKNIIATQSSFARRRYSNPEIIKAKQNGLDFIAFPSPGNGNYFALQTGVNTSSDTRINSDHVTRMVIFLSNSIWGWAGPFIGDINNPSTRSDARDALNVFLENLKNPPNKRPMIDNYIVVLDDSNNPHERQAQGFMEADIRI